MELRFLGPILAVSDEGGEIQLGGPKQRAVLALLVIRAGRLVETDSIVEELWPDAAAAEGARKTVQAYVSRLRRAFAEVGAGDVIQPRPAGYTLDPARITTDAERFSSAIDAPVSQVRQYSPTGELTRVIDFAGSGLLGLAADAVGSIYVARSGPSNGVYRIGAEGGVHLVPGTDAIIFPNALSFDKQGNLYISESFSLDPPLAEYPGCDIGFGSFFGRGGIWRVPSGGSAQLWLRHDLLTGVCAPNPIPFPVGANGIAYRQGNVYVANSEKGLVLRVPVGRSGAAGQPEIVANVFNALPPTPFGRANLDGLALDVHGDIYALAINQSRLVRVGADGSGIDVLATAADGLDFPASLAFGTGHGDRQAVFVTNFAIGPPGGMGPGLLKVAVGQPGWPLP